MKHKKKKELVKLSNELAWWHIKWGDQRKREIKGGKKKEALLLVSKLKKGLIKTPKPTPKKREAVRGIVGNLREFSKIASQGTKGGGDPRKGIKKKDTVRSNS